jgi:glycosyltransferase involved in cell wall biosynthesis
MPRAAVITRTTSRPLFLRRAVASISAQRFSDLSWIVVNDGGCAHDVNHILETLGPRQFPAQTVHRSESNGMEAAANAGLQVAEATYIAIHDDDDSWHPDFLAKTVGFLEENRSYVGVVTHTTQITERVNGNTIATGRKKPFNFDLQDIHITELFYRNLFPPISLVYRRDALESIGLYDENLPVLGDWEFNLRLIMHGDIAVIPEPLAFYHTRPNSRTGATANSIHGNAHLHKRYEAVIRNRFVRSSIRNNISSAGILMGAVSAGRRKRGFRAQSLLRKLIRSCW